MLSKGRASLLDTRWKVYFQHTLKDVRASQITPAIRDLRDDLLKGWLGKGRDEKRGARSKPLHPDTIKDIVNTALDVINFTREQKLVEHQATVPRVAVAGYLKPTDRSPKGRILSFREMAQLIDAAIKPHALQLTLLEFGSAVRIGALLTALVDQLWWHLDALDTCRTDVPQTPKWRPVIPLTGPMLWAAKEAADTAGRDNYLIHYRGQGLLAQNGYQIIARMADRAFDDPALRVKANWYSTRHTLYDFLDLRVPAKNLSVFSGHIGFFDARERRQLSRDDGSKTTRIYQQQKIAHLEPVRKAMEEEWWPRIQEHCMLDLRLNERRTKGEVSANPLKIADSGQMQD